MKQLPHPTDHLQWDIWNLGCLMGFPYIYPVNNRITKNWYTREMPLVDEANMMVRTSFTTWH